MKPGKLYEALGEFFLLINDPRENTTWTDLVPGDIMMFVGYTKGYAHKRMAQFLKGEQTFFVLLSISDSRGEKTLTLEEACKRLY